MKTNFGSPIKASSGPGPGQYSGDGMFKSISYSFGVKTGSALGVNGANPGPGAYNPMGSTNGKLNGGSSTFGGSKRLGGSMTNLNYQPGPGQYNIDGTGYGPKYGFGSANRDSQTAQGKRGGPGPGQYQSIDFHPSGSQISMKFRPNTALPTGSMPGPGAYNPNVNAVKQ